jgi:hypothetical protein
MGGENHTGPSVSDQDYHNKINRPENSGETTIDEGRLNRLRRS